MTCPDALGKSLIQLLYRIGSCRTRKGGLVAICSPGEELQSSTINRSGVFMVVLRAPADAMEALFALQPDGVVMLAAFDRFDAPEALCPACRAT
jgi:hypothetical protein